MLDEIKSAISNIRQLRMLSKDVDSSWLKEVSEKLNIVIEEKEAQEELEQLEAREHEEKIEKAKAYMLSIGLDPNTINLEQPKSKDKPKAKKSIAPPKYRFPDENGENKEWSGRGRTPLALAKLVDEGFSLDYFLIEKPDQQSEK